MARSVNQIFNIIIAMIQSDPVLSTLNSTSQTAIFRLLAYVVASSQATEEQLNDLLVAQIESIALQLAPATAPWIQAQAFKFQYNATNPQIIQFATQSFAPFYPTINPSYQIITNCSVQSPQDNLVFVKVAQGPTSSTPTPLTTTQLQAFQYYINLIKPEGIFYNCISQPADRLYSVFTITAQGAYASSISNSLLNAYNNYLFSLGFDGTIKLIDIIIALYNVEGVIDVMCNQMILRPNSIPFSAISAPGNTIIVSANTSISSLGSGRPEAITAAGYVIDEDTIGRTFLNNLTLNFI